MRLNFPTIQHKLRIRGEIMEVFDPVRRKFVAMTPEEEVRQCMLKLLIEQRAVPASLIAVERKIVFNGLAKRPDILVFDQNQSPLLLVECKAPGISLGEKVLNQASTYHQVLPAKFILFTNGTDFHVFKFEKERAKLVSIDFIPDFYQMAVAEV